LHHLRQAEASCVQQQIGAAPISLEFIHQLALSLIFLTFVVDDVSSEHICEIMHVMTINAYTYAKS
jgi:hypothetical protein